MREYTNRSLIEEPGTEPKPGDTIEVEVVNVRDGEEAQLLLSRWRHEVDRRWDKLEAAIKESPVMDVKGVSRVKGGLMVNAMGLEGFIPASLLTLNGKGVNPQNFLGQTLSVKVFEHDRRKHRLVFSRREVLEEEESKYYSPEDETRFIGIIRDICPALLREGLHIVILCRQTLKDRPEAQDIDGDFVTCSIDILDIPNYPRISLLAFSTENLGEVVEVLSQKSNEIRIFCGFD